MLGFFLVFISGCSALHVIAKDTRGHGTIRDVHCCDCDNAEESRLFRFVMLPEYVCIILIYPFVFVR